MCSLRVSSYCKVVVSRSLKCAFLIDSLSNKVLTPTKSAKHCNTSNVLNKISSIARLDSTRASLLEGAGCWKILEAKAEKVPRLFVLRTSDNSYSSC